jgi:hypothetical protein
MNFVSAIISLAFCLVIGGVGFFFMLILLNGFSGTAGDYGVYSYVGFIVLTSIIIALISFFSTSFFTRKSISNFISIVISVGISLVLSLISTFLSLVVSAVVAENIWRKK